jgi:hypothetical protein
MSKGVENILTIAVAIIAITAMIWIHNDRNWHREQLFEAMDTIVMLEDELATKDIAEKPEPDSEVPKWFAKELNNTINYAGIRIKFGLDGEEEDVVIMSGKALNRLERLARPQKDNDGYSIILGDYWDYGTCYDLKDEDDAE